MDIEITEQVDNKLFDRQDVKFVMWHKGETTPSRNKVRDLVAGKLGAKSDAVIVDHMESASGMAATRGVARAYKSLEEAKKHERKHFITRNVGAPAEDSTEDSE